MQLKLIEYETADYNAMVELRMDILRRPLGLVFTAEQLAAEKDDLLIGAYEKDELIGCGVLTPFNADTIQLRQMAVREMNQSNGTGRMLLGFAEKLAGEKGYHCLMMHARQTATGFYKKCGYLVKGNEFTEVGIPHYYMEKKLG